MTGLLAWTAYLGLMLFTKLLRKCNKLHMKSIWTKEEIRIKQICVNTAMEMG